MIINALVVAFFTSLIGLWLFRRVAPAVGLIDKPESRSQHVTPTPVGAGVTFIITLVLCFLCFPALVEGGFVNTDLTTVLIAGLAVVGLLDDRFMLNSGLRLLLYFVSAGLFLFVEIGVSSLWLYGLLLLAFVWTINLFNFMDGIDGFAIIQALLVFVGLAAILSVTDVPQTPGLINILLLLIFCCFPMVFFNWPPASVFMGDAGAICLGFLLAAVGVRVTLMDFSLGWVWLILMMPFLVDATVTLGIRVTRGQAPHVAHRDHAYQRLTRITGSALVVNLGLLLLHLCWLFPLAMLSLSGVYSRMIAVILATIPPLALLVYARRRA
jgi:Fuc2NAc and GlcNAc transferase